MKGSAPVPSWIFPAGLQQKTAAWSVWLRHDIPQAPVKLGWYCHPGFNSELLIPSDTRFRIELNAS